MTYVCKYEARSLGSGDGPGGGRRRATQRIWIVPITLVLRDRASNHNLVYTLNRSLKFVMFSNTIVLPYQIETPGNDHAGAVIVTVDEVRDDNHHPASKRPQAAPTQAAEAGDKSAKSKAPKANAGGNKDELIAENVAGNLKNDSENLKEISKTLVDLTPLKGTKCFKKDCRVLITGCGRSGTHFLAQQLADAGMLYIAVREGLFVSFVVPTHQTQIQRARSKGITALLGTASCFRHKGRTPPYEYSSGDTPACNLGIYLETFLLSYVKSPLVDLSLRYADCLCVYEVMVRTSR